MEIMSNSEAAYKLLRDRFADAAISHKGHLILSAVMWHVTYPLIQELYLTHESTVDVEGE